MPNPNQIGKKKKKKPSKYKAGFLPDHLAFWTKFGKAQPAKEQEEKNAGASGINKPNQPQTPDTVPGNLQPPQKFNPPKTALQHNAIANQPPQKLNPPKTALQRKTIANQPPQKFNPPKTALQPNAIANQPPQKFNPPKTALQRNAIANQPPQKFNPPKTALQHNTIANQPIFPEESNNVGVKYNKNAPATQQISQNKQGQKKTDGNSGLPATENTTLNKSKTEEPKQVLTASKAMNESGVKPTGVGAYLARLQNNPGLANSPSSATSVSGSNIITVVGKNTSISPATSVSGSNNNQNVITIVGKETPRQPQINQKKKILQFQMKMQAIQEAKERIKNIQARNALKAVVMPQSQPVPHPVPMPMATNMLNLSGMPQMTGVPNPNTMYGLSGGMSVNVNTLGMPMTSGIPVQHVNPTFTGVPHPSSMPNVGPVPNPHLPNVSMIQQQFPIIQPQLVNIQPQTPISVVPVTQPEFVETVFQNDQSFNKKPNRFTTQQHNSLNPDQWTQVDAYGFRYPKGIPRSFLQQQTQQQMSGTSQANGPIWSTPNNTPAMVQPPQQSPSTPLTVQTDGQTEAPQAYSPSELYSELDQGQEPDLEDQDSNEFSQSGQKRLSAFRRLGPQTQPKKTKLTISVKVNDEQNVREVVDETEEEEIITPVHLREDMILSTDETVMKYLKAWPWKRKVILRKSVTARNSKTVMILEREQMEEVYDRESLFIQVSVTGYPSSWKKEQVLDVLLETVRGHTFIPCFIDFNKEECKFLTLRCRSALLSIHKYGFVIHRDNVELTITISQTEISLNHVDFIPRLVIRKKLNMCTDGENKLDLSEFTLKEDISHFIYYPLNRLNNQLELVQMQSEVKWYLLTHLNLSRNKISNFDGFDLEQITPKLKHLDVSYNCIDKINTLLKFRELPLKSIKLEGNPLCINYTEPDQYVKVIRMIFSGVSTIDDVPVRLKGDMPQFRRNYCPTDAKDLIDKYLDIYFPLLDGDIEHRALLQDMYEDNAVMTITYNYKLAFSPIFRCFKPLFQNARHLDQGKMTMLKGSSNIIKNIIGWPHTEHDPFTFTVDVIQNNDTNTIVRIDGILKLTRESLAEDEHLLAFSRTLVLQTRDYVEYKIKSEMLYWSAPVGAYAKTAFAVTTIKTKQMNPKIDSTTDEKLQVELLKIFMKLTAMEQNASERCLEMKKWNLKEALDHFTKMLKLDSLETLTKIL